MSKLTMKPEEHIRRAERLCERMRNASSRIGSGDRQRFVRGVDPNELKKILSYLIESRDMNRLRLLVTGLPNSNFAKRSGSTPAYYRNIQMALNEGFYNLPMDDAIIILGWACSLL